MDLETRRKITIGGLGMQGGVNTLAFSPDVHVLAVGGLTVVNQDSTGDVQLLNMSTRRTMAASSEPMPQR